MAWVTNEKTAQVRRDLKAAFPEMKFSVRKRDHSAVSVAIVSGPYNFLNGDNGGRQQVNPYGKATTYRTVTDDPYNNGYETKEYAHADVLNRILEIIHVGNWDKSEPMTDYCDVGFFVDLSIGHTEPYKLTGEIPKAEALPTVEHDGGGIDEVQVLCVECGEADMLWINPDAPTADFTCNKCGRYNKLTTEESGVVSYSEAEQRAAFREVLTKRADELRAAGEVGKADGLELAREYYTNPAFRKWLQDTCWDLTNMKGAN